MVAEQTAKNVRGLFFFAAPCNVNHRVCYSWVCYSDYLWLM